MRYFLKDDFVVTDDSASESPKEGFIAKVSDDRKKIMIEQKWYDVENFRWCGSKSFFLHRLFEQDDVVEQISHKTFYSEKRKIEVLNSARVIRNNFFTSITKYGFLPHDYKPNYLLKLDRAKK